MKTYGIEFTKSARTEIKKLPAKAQKGILSAISKLAESPRRGNVRPMTGVSSWRLRVGDYRVIYDIHDKKLVIVIIRVRHRKDAYRS